MSKNTKIADYGWTAVDESTKARTCPGGLLIMTAVSTIFLKTTSESHALQWIRQEKAKYEKAQEEKAPT